MKHLLHCLCGGLLNTFSIQSGSVALLGSESPLYDCAQCDQPESSFKMIVRSCAGDLIRAPQPTNIPATQTAIYPLVARHWEMPVLFRSEMLTGGVWPSENAGVVRMPPHSCDASPAPWPMFALSFDLAVPALRHSAATPWDHISAPVPDEPAADVPANAAARLASPAPLRMTLQRAYYALGRHVHRHRRWRRHFGDLHRRINSLRQARRKQEAMPASDLPMWDFYQNTGLKHAMKLALIELGKSAFELRGRSSGPGRLTAFIAASVVAPAAPASWSRRGAIATARHLVSAPVALAKTTALAILTSLLGIGWKTNFNPAGPPGIGTGPDTSAPHPATALPAQHA